METSTAALTLSTAVAVPTIMGAFTPAPADIATGSSDPARLAELRRGEIIGACIAIGLSLTLAGAVAADGKIIAITALVMVGVFVAERERAIRAAPGTPSIAA